MINASVLMPLGYLFKIFQGMKSGWSNTANDNTLIHEIAFRLMMRYLGVYILHVLYGDDNFMLVPDHITDEMLVKAYAMAGCVVGRIHSSVYIGDVDFLSKYVIYRDGDYYVYRPAIETHARMIMPEEMNPAHRDRPDPIIAAERTLGHLLDNPFNSSVYQVCTSLLGKLNKHYGIGRIEVTEEMRKKYPWRGFSDLPQYMPVLPSDEFIMELYGVSKVKLFQKWPAAPELRSFDWNAKARDCESFYSAAFYSESVVRRLSTIARKKLRGFIKRMSPFRVPDGVYGTHAARLECVIRKYGIVGDSVLDLGAHPGACTMSCLKFASHVTAVTLQPPSANELCPYIMRDDDVKVIEHDADTFVPGKVFDVVHDDVDLMGRRDRLDDMRQAQAAIKRALRYSKYCKCYIFTIRDISPHRIVELYDLYKVYGRFDMVKPHYSNPWRIEYMVVLRKSNDDRKRRSHFMQSINHMLNADGGSLIAWSSALSDKIYEMLERGEISECPMRNDEEYQDALAEAWTIPTKDM
jgi:23S rRNA U2552 (ribose-2'-O)-methylase RlmE/FtsJ